MFVGDTIGPGVGEEVNPQQSLDELVRLANLQLALDRQAVEAMKAAIAALNSGESCAKCKAGYYVVANSSIQGGSRVQYLACKKCGFRPDGNKRILKIDQPTPRFVRRASVST